MRLLTLFCVLCFSISNVTHAQNVSDRNKQAMQSKARAAQGTQEQGKEQINQRGKKRFSEVQRQMRSGKIKFIGGKPTFKIKPNPILNHPIKSVTGDNIPRNIKSIAKEQRVIANKIKAVEQEYITAARAKGIDLDILVVKNCPDRTRFDWRSLGKVTPVKHQASCGSCTTFGTLGAFEGNNAVRNGGLWDSSEQHLLSCEPNVDCSGGSRPALAQYMVDTGTSTEAAYAYTATDSACNTAILTPHDAIAWDHVSGANPTVSELKEALCEYGPIAIGIWATSAFQAYDSGIYNETVSTTQSNHAMTLVGWDNSDGGYWIVKNSWGTTDWGESGFGRIAWGSNNVGKWANWIQAPIIKIMRPADWKRVLIARKVPLINRYILR